MNHEGYSWHRLAPECDNPREVAFASQWRKENEVDGRTPIITSLIPGCTQRDATVAATVIQWLGSNVGMSFLSNVVDSSPEVARFLGVKK